MGERRREIGASSFAKATGDREKGRRTWNIEHRTSNIQHRTSNIEL